MINKYGFSDDWAPPILKLDEDDYKKFSNELQLDFRDIIAYLRSECDQFHILHTSNFGTIDDRYPGINDILKFIMPKTIRFI